MNIVDVWKKIIVGQDKSWVLFENGTCVILMKPEQNLAAQATALMKEWGPVHGGSPAGDFSVITLDDDLGYVVTCHHPDILTFVEFDASEKQDFVIGLRGRSLRGLDAENLRVIHVEDRR